MVVTKEARNQSREVSRMSRRTAAWLAWSVCAVCVVLIVLALLLDFLTGEVIQVRPDKDLTRPRCISRVISLAFPTVRALIASPSC